MRAIIICIFTATMLLVSPSDAGIAGFLTQEHRNWSFIQSVGGIEVRLDGKKLKVSCDVSGLHEITTKPTIVNSGIGVRTLKCQRVGANIQLSVVTSVFEKGMSSACGSIDLAKYPSGAYSVEYLDSDGKTHPLGKIVLP